MATPIKERTFESDEKLKLPRPFILRRLHSILGLWLVIYLTQHLLVNAQAAFFFEDEGYGFIAAVNKLESIPYLRAVELLLLGLPFFLHGVLGMYYAWTSKSNAHRSDGSAPALPQYKRNRAYSWERITAWLLVFGIVAHVVQMRFVDYPVHTEHQGEQSYSVRLTTDKGLTGVAEKLHVTLHPSGNNEVVGVSSDPGSAFFLVVRETFKSPLMVILYSLFVIAAAYHAFNGLWTVFITWGITLTRRSQKRMRAFTNLLMGVVMLLGLMAAWGTYWTIQFQG